jgi:ABC-type microcin C transport system permease subunit YejB
MEIFDESWEAVLVQRMFHRFHFADYSENFYKSFGLFEIIIKSLTVSFFLGTLFYFWRSGRELQSFNAGVHRPAESNWNKYLSNIF